MALDASADGLWDHDLVTGRVFYSARLGEIIGLPPVEGVFDAASWSARMHPDDFAVVDPQYQAIQGTRDRLDITYRVRCEDGSWKWVRTRTKVVGRGRDGRPVRMAGTVTDVDEDVRLREALRASEARFRALASSAPVGIFLADTEGKGTYLNREGERIIGMSVQQALMFGWANHLHPADRERVFRDWEEAVRSGSDYEGEYRFDLPGTGEKWVRCYISALTGESGEKTGYVGVLVDITDRRSAETKLQTSQERLQEAQRLAHIGDWDLDLQTGVLVWSDEIFRIFEIDPTRFGASYEAFLAAIHPEDRVSVNEAYTRSVANRTPYEITHRLLLPGGRVKYVQEHCETFYAPDGKVLRSVGTVQDITDRMKAQAALRESELRFRQLANEIPVGIYQTAPNGEMRFVNPTWLKITGLSESEAFSPDAGKVIHPEDRERVVQLWTRAISTGTEFAGEYRLRGRDGRDTWVRGFGAAVRNQDGVVTSYVGALIDTSEARRLQAELAQAARLAAMGTLVTGVAHEINNPLAAAMANQEVAMEIISAMQATRQAGTPVDADAELRELREAVSALEDAREAGQRIARIVKEMAALVRPNSPRVVVRLSDAVGAAVAGLPPAIAAAATILVEDHGAPGVLAPEGDLEKVVTSLVMNAIEATRTGTKGKIVVRIATSEVGGARLEVMDHGVGILPEAQAKLFDPFYTTRPVGKRRGIGLGLPLSRAIIGSCGGTISVVSEAGKGSTFRVELPAAAAGA